MGNSILRDKSYSFAIRIVKLSQYLQTEKKEFVLSRQILKSGTAIGALIKEAQFGQSRADFINKMNISLKEANETEYWLSLLKDCFLISNEEFLGLNKEAVEIKSMLIATIKTSKKIN